MIDEVKKFIQSRSMDKVLAKAETPLLDDREIERVEIIVLKYKSPEMEKDCISRIVEFTEWPYKLNIFDNRGNGPNTAKAWNKLIKESTCDYVLFIDSDAFVQPRIPTIDNAHTGGDRKVCWLTEMMKAFKIQRDVAIVGPVCGTPATSTMQSMKPKDEDPMRVDGHISGYCFLTRKDIYDEIGYFDEDFCFYGQESDWIEKILENGKYKIMVAPRAYVIHGYDNEGSQAARQAVEEGELSVEQDSSYSHLMWNLKKKLRLREGGINYEFKF